jgi:hypothetical protein
MAGRGARPAAGNEGERGALMDQGGRNDAAVAGGFPANPPRFFSPAGPNPPPSLVGGVNGGRRVGFGGCRIAEYLQ